MSINVKNIINSDAAYEILDRSNCAGSTWTEGGCAILAQAIHMVNGYPIYVIYNEKFGSAEHLGVMTPSGAILDGDGKHKNIDSWLEFFKENEIPRDGNLIVIPYNSDVNMEDINFDDSASKELAVLIKNHKMIRENLRNIIKESVSEKYWYHGTPDVRELEKEGGFTHKYLDIEYVDDIEGWERIKGELKAARESGDEDEYFRILDMIGDFKKRIKIRKPIFFTNIYSVAKTYADPQRAFDYQNSIDKVLKVKIKPGIGVTIDASGDRFRFIGIDKVRQGFLNAGVDEKELDLVIKKLNFAVGFEKGIKTDNIAAIGEWFGFDYIDVNGVLDSYHGGSVKSTVRMVFNPSDIEIVKESNNMNEIRKIVRRIIKEEVIEETHTGQKELQKLTNDILKSISKEIIKSKAHMVFLTDNEDEPITGFPTINTSMYSGDGFEELSDFVKETNIIIIPTKLIRGKENIKGELEYNPSDRLGNELYKIWIKYDNENLDGINELFKIKGKSITENDIYFNIFYLWYSILLHELQHAYDAWRSKGKAFGGQFTKSYTALRNKANQVMKTKSGYDELTPEEIEALNDSRIAYLNLVHEINARYAQAIQKTVLKTMDWDTLDDIKKDWNIVYGDFKSNFDGWRHLSDKMKKKITRRLAKAYQEESENLKTASEKYSKEDIESINENLEIKNIVRKLIRESLLKNEK